jgi:hypothetical protein
MKILQITAAVAIGILATQKVGVSWTEIVGMKELLLSGAIAILVTPQVSHWFE